MQLQGTGPSGSGVWKPVTNLDPQAATGISVGGAAPNGSIGINGQPAGSIVQSNANAAGYVDPAAPASGAGVGTAVDPAAAASSAQAAADALKAQQLRDQITGLVHSVKDIFNSRYGTVDASGTDQAGKLQTRFGNETGDISHQVTDNTNQAGGAFAARGTRDSSDYGNSVDDITLSGKNQVRDLGTELQDNLDKIAQWAATQKQSLTAQNGGMDAIMSHLSEETNPNNLTTLRNTIEAKIADLNGGGADNNTVAQNRSTLESIAPSNARAQTLKTTLSSILGGNAAPQQKAAIANSLITNAGLDPAEAQKLNQAFQVDLANTQQPPQQPAA